MDYYKEFEPTADRTKPVIKGTQVTLNAVLEKLSEGCTIEDITKVFPEITKENVIACIMFASELSQQAFTARMKDAKMLADKFRKLKGSPISLMDAKGNEIKPQ